MADALKDLSDALAAVVEQTGSGIVRVNARQRLPATGIVWSDDGLIVTAHHVVEDDEGITVNLPDGSSADATLVGRDPGSDLALLRTTASLAAPNWADNDDLKVGHLVLALGRPGERTQATLGVVSAIGDTSHRPERRQRRKQKSRHGRRGGGKFGPGMMWFEREFSRHMGHGGVSGTHIRTDVVMYPGFSGGPLVDAGGQIRGVNTSGLMRGASLTIPVDRVRAAVDTLLSHGRIRRGFLGIGLQPAQLPEALADELEQDTGLLIVSVEADSPATKGGLLVGDMVVALDGEATAELDELLSMLTGDRVGKTVPVKIVRGGQLQEITVTIGERM